MDEAFPVYHRQLRPTAGATQDLEMQIGMVMIKRGRIIIVPIHMIMDD